MAETVQGAIRELMEQTTRTMDALLEASDRAGQSLGRLAAGPGHRDA